MTHDPSRKRFLAKVLGLATAGALAPRAVAHAIVAEKGGGDGGKRPVFTLRTQDRAIARRDGAA